VPARAFTTISAAASARSFRRWSGSVGEVALVTAIGIFAAISYAIVILAALVLPETRGKELLVN
jgi:hypothetical protein